MPRSHRKNKGGKRRAAVTQKSTPAMLAQAPHFEHGEDASLSMFFLANALPADFASAFAAGRQDETVQAVQIDSQQHNADDGSIQLQLSAGLHRLRLSALPQVAPQQVIGHALDCSHWGKPQKDVLRAHTHHYFCQYLGGSADAGEQLLAMHRLALLLMESGVIGTVDPEAWNCVPIGVLHQLLNSESHESLINDPPLEIWAGFAKLFLSDNEVWFCSKAFHRWGVVDFAWHGIPAQGSEAFELFRGLFNYVRDSEAVLKVGHTAQFGDDLILRFAPLSEYQDYLQGPLGTLVIERLDPRQFH